MQPNHIVFNNINAIEDIYGHNTKTDKSENYTMVLKSSKYPASIVTEVYFPVQSWNADFQTRNKTRHGFLRRIISPSFGPTSLKALEPTMNRYYNYFLTGIETRANMMGGIVEMNEWFHNLSFDVNIVFTRLSLMARLLEL